MGKNIFSNLILSLIFLTVIFFGYAIVKSVDLLRLREEKIVQNQQNLLSSIKQISRKLNNFSLTPATFASTKTSPDSKSSDSKIKNYTNSKQIANLEFYDKNSDFGGRKISALTSQTKNMNYMVNNESLVSSIWGYCYDSLAERNYAKPEKFQPMLAESWTLSEDKMTYTIHLKKGILWHDFTDPVSGKQWNDVPVTAQDFKFYVDVIKNPDTDCAPIRTYMKDLDRIEVISDYTFKVHWKKKYFLSENMTLGLQPLPRHLYHAYKEPFDGKRFNDDHERNRIVVGCGPYRFAGWDKGQRIILKKWDKYYGNAYGVAPPIENIELKIIPNKNTQFQALIGKKIDEMSLSPDQWINNTNIKEFDEKNGFLKKLKYPARVYRYIGYNLKRPLFKDKRVRKGLSHLVDRKRIIKEVYHGLARIITGNFFIDTAYNDKSIKPYSFSLEKAKALFKEAGWTDTNGDGILDKDGKLFEFTIIAPNNSPTYDKMLPMIKEDMAKAGVIMNISKIEWSVFVQLLGKKNFDACICGWGMGLESDPYQLWHSSQADIPESSNHVGFKNKKADELIEKIRVCFNLKERIKLCHEFHKIMHEEQPYTFLFSPYSLSAIDKRYQNVRIFPIGVPDKIQWVPKQLQKRVVE
jgi:peptide/nickel transport system substrate-binding protein